MASDSNEAQSSGGEEVALDDVMIAMDVVDTLRHDKRIVERELNDETRREDLIRRLRELYRGQGIEVPDHILEEGVKALEEERFVYKPPEAGLQRRLAELYVSRDTWGRFMLGAVAGLFALWLGWYLIYERPRLREAEAVRIELGERLPSSLKSLVGQIKSEARSPEVLTKAEQLSRQGHNAAKSGDRTVARESETELSALLQALRQEYEVKIVSRKGELSGLWRIPKLNPNARNYYLIVEAVGADGKPIDREVTNEETGERERVRTWAIRVPQSELERVQADKRDDGIIQRAVVGSKRRGEIEPRWLIDIAGGAITRW